MATASTASVGTTMSDGVIDFIVCLRTKLFYTVFLLAYGPVKNRKETNAWKNEKEQHQQLER